MDRWAESSAISATKHAEWSSSSHYWIRSENQKQFASSHSSSRDSVESHSWTSDSTSSANDDNIDDSSLSPPPCARHADDTQQRTRSDHQDNENDRFQPDERGGDEQVVRKDQLRCPYCERDVLDDQPGVTLVASKWHKNCFRCNRCSRQLQSLRGFICLQNWPVCVECFLAAYPLSGNIQDKLPANVGFVAIPEPDSISSAWSGTDILSISKSEDLSSILSFCRSTSPDLRALDALDRVHRNSTPISIGSKQTTPDHGFESSHSDMFGSDIHSGSRVQKGNDGRINATTDMNMSPTKPFERFERHERRDEQTCRLLSVEQARRGMQVSSVHKLSQERTTATAMITGSETFVVQPADGIEASRIKSDQKVQQSQWPQSAALCRNSPQSTVYPSERAQAAPHAVAPYRPHRAEIRHRRDTADTRCLAFTKQMYVATHYREIDRCEIVVSNRGPTVNVLILPVMAFILAIGVAILAFV